MRWKPAAVCILLAAAAGWVGYVQLWRHAGGRPLAWHDATAAVRGFEPARPLSRVTRRGGAERVLVAAGPRSSSGYAIDVVRAEVERGRVLIVVHERAPTRAHPGRPGVTYPYRLLVFPTIDKPVHVGWKGRP